MNANTWKVIAAFMSVLLGVTLVYFQILHNGASEAIQNNTIRVAENERHSEKCDVRTNAIKEDINEIKGNIKEITKTTNDQSVKIEGIKKDVGSILKGIERLERNNGP